MMIHIPLFCKVYHFEEIVVTPLKLPLQQLLASCFQNPVGVAESAAHTKMLNH